jgi:ribosome maturation factor RimP
VIELLDGEFARAGYDIEDVVIDDAARRVTIVAGGDQLDLDVLATLARTASEFLDSADGAPDGGVPYELEVTSPGVDRPLTLERHYRRAQGRKVEVTLSDGSQLTGRLGETADGTVRLVTRGGRNRAAYGVQDLSLSDIAKAVVQVEFSPPNQHELELAGMPADSAGEPEEGDDA